MAEVFRVQVAAEEVAWLLGPPGDRSPASSAKDGATASTQLRVWWLYFRGDFHAHICTQIVRKVGCDSNVHAVSSNSQRCHASSRRTCSLLARTGSFAVLSALATTNVLLLWQSHLLLTRRPSLVAGQGNDRAASQPPL